MVRSQSAKRWVPLLCWLIIIFVGSSIPHLSGDKFGMPAGSDKIAHFFEYLILAVLFYRGAREEHGRGILPAWLLVVMVGLAIGMLDEFHQRFIPGRDSNIWDWTADATGIVCGTIIASRLRLRAGRRAREA